MFRAKKTGGGVVFSTFINRALLMMVIHLRGDAHKATMCHKKNLLVVKIVVIIFNMILHDLERIVKPGNLIPLERIFGVDLPSLTITVQRAAHWWGDTYPSVNTLIGHLLNHVRLLNVLVTDGGNWANANCGMC